ncbi:hypothetical protein Shyhy02_14520 [Streptomyces hygroscopicus subsp. hygroscopicus]|nr:hypothetical protein Shyhy02_14520 [Streptomyces hygroscopicus subsp. hygroscopicus]
MKTATPSPGGSAAPSALMRATTPLTVRGASRDGVGVGSGMGIVMDARVAARTYAVPPSAAASPGRLNAASTGVSQRPPRRAPSTSTDIGGYRRIQRPPAQLVAQPEALLSSEHAQRLIVHTARPGSDSAERLELLRVVGLQDLAPREALQGRGGFRAAVASGLRWLQGCAGRSLSYVLVPASSRGSCGFRCAGARARRTW